MFIISPQHLFEKLKMIGEHGRFKINRKIFPVFYVSCDDYLLFRFDPIFLNDSILLFLIDPR